MTLTNLCVDVLSIIFSYACSDSLLLTPLCCDDIYDVTPRVSALAGCDRLVSEALVIENDSLLLTPLCCDDIHDVTPRVSALARCDRLVSEPDYRIVVMSLPARASRAKFHWGTAFATGRKHFTNPEMKLRMKHTNRRVRIPKGLYPCRIEEKLTKKQVGGKWILVKEMLMISKDGEISKFPKYHSSGEEVPTEQPRDEDEPLEHEALNKEVESDLESTASSKPKWKKIAKADPDRASRNYPYCSK
ncbi:hypothetical protein Tco_1457266 [Tanacetum coccineum]